MNQLLTIIKEQNADFMKKFFCYRMDGDKIGDHVGAQLDVQDFHRSTLITLLDANCVRLKLDKRDIDFKPYSTEWYMNRAANQVRDEELALYGALISELKAN